MKHHKNVEQRTFLQDRFEIIIKKQKAGTASFIELTELDEMVNRYATIRDTILKEMRENDRPFDKTSEKDIQVIPKKQTTTLFARIKSWLGRVFCLLMFDRQSKLICC